MEDFDSKEHPEVFLNVQKRRMDNLSTFNGPLNIMESWVAWQRFFLSLSHSFLAPAGAFRTDLCKSSSFTRSLKVGQYSDNPKSCGFELCHGAFAVLQSSEMMFVPLWNWEGKEEKTETMRRYCRRQKMRESNSRAWDTGKEAGQGWGWWRSERQGEKKAQQYQSQKLMLPWASKKKKNKQTNQPHLGSALHSSEKVLHFLPKHTNKFLHSGRTLMMKKLHLPKLIATIHHQAVALYPVCTQRENPQHHLSRQKKDLAVIYCSVWLMPVGRGATVQMGVKIRLPSGEFMPGELNPGNFCLCFTWNFSIKYEKSKKKLKNTCLCRHLLGLQSDYRKDCLVTWATSRTLFSFL